MTFSPPREKRQKMYTFQCKITVYILLDRKCTFSGMCLRTRQIKVHGTFRCNLPYVRTYVRERYKIVDLPVFSRQKLMIASRYDCRDDFITKSKKEVSKVIDFIGLYHSFKILRISIVKWIILGVIFFLREIQEIVHISRISIFSKKINPIQF